MSVAGVQKNFRELLAAKGISLLTLARLLGLGTSHRTLRRDVALKGRATPDEAERIAEILNVSITELNAVLSETAHRPGERDARGRKKLTAALGGVNGKRINGGAEHVAVAPHGGDEGRQSGGTRP